MTVVEQLQQWDIPAAAGNRTEYPIPVLPKKHKHNHHMAEL